MLTLVVCTITNKNWLFYTYLAATVHLRGKHVIKVSLRCQKVLGVLALFNKGDTETVRGYQWWRSSLTSMVKAEIVTDGIWWSMTLLRSITVWLAWLLCTNESYGGHWWNWTVNVTSITNLLTSVSILHMYYPFCLLLILVHICRMQHILWISRKHVCNKAAVDNIENL